MTRARDSNAVRPPAAARWRRGGAAAGVAVALAAALAVGAQTPASRDVASLESAYRSNNVGVALLEQFRYEDAVRSFRAALLERPDLELARLNLGIALFYAADTAGARRVLGDVLKRDPGQVRADYVLGLLARQEGQGDEAVERFFRVLARRPDDLGANLAAAQVLVQARRYDEAIPLLERTIARHPHSATAAYNLGLALARSGRPEEGRRFTALFQQLRDSPYATTLGNGYLDQGRLAEAVASTGAEPGLVDRSLPPVRFEPTELDGPGGSWVSVNLAELGADGPADLLAVAGQLRIGHLGVGGAAPEWSQPLGPARSAVAADLDGDARPDILVLDGDGVRLLRSTSAGFEDATAGSGLGRAGGATTAALVDTDHDGDLDVFLAGASGHRLWRNDGSGVFSDVSQASGLGGGGLPVAVVPTDFDDGRDVDLLVVSRDSPPVLYRNLRDGRFEDVAADAGLPRRGFSCVAVGDVNRDGSSDFLLGGDHSVLAVSDGTGHFAVVPAPGPVQGARAALLIDYDRDGLLDIVASTPAGLRLVRGLGDAWIDVTASALPDPAAAEPGSWLAAGDVDGDSRPDLVVVSETSARLWRSSGGTNRSLAVSLAGRVSNRSGVGARVEVRAGSLHGRFEVSAATPPAAPAGIVFGLGPRPTADAVRVLWPSGVLQSELEIPPPPPGGASRLAVRELDRKPSSCPYLYVWNGDRFEFVTDFMGGGEMGYLLAPGQFNHPDPVEQVRLGDVARPRDGRYEIRVTNELEEALFVDRLELLVVDHPDGVEVYPDEGMTSPPKPDRLVAVRDARPPRGAWDQAGRDVLGELRDVDRRWPDGFGLERVRGYAAPHALVLDLGPLPERPVLLLTGWTDYAFSSDNRAAHQAGLALHPPSLEAEWPDGTWRTVAEQVGIPVGRPQTVVADLAGRLPAGVSRVRISTSMRVYWDRIVVADQVDTPLTARRLAPESARLRERGFSAAVSPDGREPFGFDYARVSLVSPWKAFPGRYTRLGDVGELLARSDDVFVVSRPGDEIALAFTAPPPPPAGTRRTVLLVADGYSKEMDINSATPDSLGPLPFHAMTRYPYGGAERFPMSAERRRIYEATLTRVVGAALPPVDATLLPEIPTR